MVTFVPEIIGPSDTFPMIDYKAEAKLIRPMPIVSLYTKEYLPCNEMERQKHSIRPSKQILLRCVSPAYKGTWQREHHSSLEKIARFEGFLFLNLG